MTKLITFILFLILTSLGCESELDKIPDGVYSGTFQRQPAFGGGEIAQVSITVSSNTWTGQSNIQKYPALCHGTYKLENNKIVITNLCEFTTDFDWSLILSGEYDFTLNGKQLEIIRNYSGPATDTWTDKYALTRQ